MVVVVFRILVVVIGNECVCVMVVVVFRILVVVIVAVEVHDY
jgi:hypothetical protein